MPNQDVDMGLKCVLKYVRWWETWHTVFPLYLGGNGTPLKGWKGATEISQRPYERLITTFVHNPDFKYHWVVNGIFGLAMEAGLYRAGDCNYPYPELVFDFPPCAVSPVPPYRQEPVPQEEVDYAYFYLKIRAILPSPESIVCFSFAHPWWLATNLGSECCVYTPEGGNVKSVRYTLRQNVAKLFAAAFISQSPVEWDCGPLPEEYNGVPNPNVKWLECRGPFSSDPNNPTEFTIDLTAVIDP